MSNHNFFLMGLAAETKEGKAAIMGVKVFTSQPVPTALECLSEAQKINPTIIKIGVISFSQFKDEEAFKNYKTTPDVG